MIQDRKFKVSLQVFQALAHKTAVEKVVQYSLKRWCIYLPVSVCPCQGLGGYSFSLPLPLLWQSTDQTRRNCVQTGLKLFQEVLVLFIFILFLPPKFYIFSQLKTLVKLLCFVFKLRHKMVLIVSVLIRRQSDKTNLSHRFDGF